MKYSVLLMRPDSIADPYLRDGGHDTFYTFVEADTRSGAVAAAQQEAFRADAGEDDDPGFTSLDYAEILVIEGHHPAC
jgi:hypothetical protein